MDFVGKTVTKRFEGFGVFTGKVQSYDASSGFFEIAYRDGDFEELDFHEVAALLEEKENGAGEALLIDSSHKTARLGRKPKKRRRLEPRRRENDGEGEARDLDMNRSADLNDAFVGDLGASEGANGYSDRNVNINENETLEKGSDTGGFDLNLNLNEGFDLNEEGDNTVNCSDFGRCSGEEMKRECIDLNLDVNGELDEGFKQSGETHKRACGFDLNLRFDDQEEEEIMEVRNVEVKEEGTNCKKMEEVVFSLVEGKHDRGGASNACSGVLGEVGVSNDLNGGLRDGIREEGVGAGEGFMKFDEGKASVNDTGFKEDGPEVIDGNRGDIGSVCEETRGGQKRRGRRRKVVDNLNRIPETPIVDANGVTANGDCLMASQETMRRRRRGRRKKLVDHLNSTPEATVVKEVDGVQEDCAMGINGNQGGIGSAYKEEGGSGRRGRRRKVADNLNSKPETTVFTDAIDIKDDFTTGVDENQGNMGSAYKEVSGTGRKKRKIPDSMSLAPETTVLRRSTRRGSLKNYISSITTTNVINDSGSPAVSTLTEDKLVKSPCEWPEEPVILPPKAQLPPSSRSLDLDGIPVLDLFSIYACLRSFSTFLFLSPFELEEFVTALKCNSPNPLFDCIHVCILQTLRKHLEYLSNEGSESASSCLRHLKWGLLDLITWPVFMVEYFLIHGSELKPGFDLSHLQLFKCDYHKQPVSVKVEILRCLCDDMIEADAIRIELNRRSSGVEPDLDFERNANLGAYKKRRAAVDVSGGSCLTEETADDAPDWNSDECCLCKMDGNLICCDGCPAAYHSKCVGVANSSLPEGDWYCPECAIDRHKPWMKPRKTLRGAQLLGVDPYGHLYFSSCGYLLVSDSCVAEFSFNYYHRNDLNVVIEVLKSSGKSYGSLLEAIQKHWDMPGGLYGAGSKLYPLSHSVCLDMCVPSGALASSEICAAKNNIADGRKADEQFVSRFSGQLDVEVSKSVSPTSMSSEGSAETTQMSTGNHNFQNEGLDCFSRSADFSNESETPDKPPTIGADSLTSSSLEVKQEQNRASVVAGHANATHGETIQMPPRTGYMNYYSFGYTASSIAEALMGKSSDKTIDDSTKSYEEIISAQMKVISKKATKFQWPNMPSLNADVQKEMCGWCFSCRFPTDDSDCLLNMCLGPIQEGSLSEVVGRQSKRHRKGYLTVIICHILLIENRLQGLLVGPWLNPHYSRIWRKNIQKASDIAAVKRSLLLLESNLRHLALSADWLKHVDSAVTMGSASHFFTASLRSSAKNGISRKRVRSSDFECNPSSNSASGLGMLWWRGGRLSRQLFSWKVLPCSLASKAARQAGSTKIPGILYPENSDFAKRSKCVVWRAAVESSATVEQLALQVRELDSNIRWNEIENSQPPPLLDKEFRKSIRLFKKVIIRRKCAEGDGAKYLLDFGKRRSIPEVVLKNGLLVEESSSERKKYWLNESYVPLHILKNFEEKRITRKSSMMGLGKYSETSAFVNKFLKKQGFSYLFARAERSEYHQCGHCNKDVLIREAVCCQHCKGFFHKRHVRKSAGSLIAECVYTCHRCKDGKPLKVGAERRKCVPEKGKNNTMIKKVQLQNSKRASGSSTSVRLKNSKKVMRSLRPLRSQNKKKVVVVVPLRRSPRKTKYKGLQRKRPGGRKKGKQVKSRKGSFQKAKKETSWHKRRTPTYYSYWVNGLLLTRKPDDEKGMHFRGKRLILPSESVILEQPKCILCYEAGYRSTLSYIACELCGEWFHGDAFGLHAQNITKLIGFRCHVCREMTPPVCPHLPAMRSHESKVDEVQNDVGIGLSEEVTEAALDDQDSLPVDELDHLELGIDLVSNPSVASEFNVEGKNGHALSSLKEKTYMIQSSNENFRSDLLTSSNENIMLEGSVKSQSDAVVTSHDEVQPSCPKIDVHALETECVVRA